MPDGLEDPPVLLDRVAVRSKRWIRDRTVPLLRSGHGAVDLLGSGVLLEVAGRGFLVTAAHVADVTTREGQLLAIPTGRAREAPLVITSDNVTSSAMPASRWREDDSIDVAVIALREETCLTLRDVYRFTRMSEVQSADAPTTESLVGFLGYPNAMVENVPGLHFKYEASFSVTCAVAPPREMNAEVQTRSLVLGFSKSQMTQYRGTPGRGGRRYRPVNPHGVSGGGAWILAGSASRIGRWSEDEIRLSAVVHTWDRRGGRIVGTRTAIPLVYIYRDYPGLRRPILLSHPVIERLAKE
jgi:hypothetical protein